MSHDLLVESWVLPTQSLNTVVFYTTKSRVNLVNCCLEAENPSAAANMTCAEYYTEALDDHGRLCTMVIRIRREWGSSHFFLYYQEGIQKFWTKSVEKSEQCSSKCGLLSSHNSILWKMRCFEYDECQHQRSFRVPVFVSFDHYVDEKYLYRYLFVFND